MSNKWNLKGKKIYLQSTEEWDIYNEWDKPEYYDFAVYYASDIDRLKEEMFRKIKELFIRRTNPQVSEVLDIIKELFGDETD